MSVRQSREMTCHCEMRAVNVLAMACDMCLGLRESIDIRTEYIREGIPSDVSSAEKEKEEEKHPTRPTQKDHAVPRRGEKTQGPTTAALAMYENMMSHFDKHSKHQTPSRCKISHTSKPSCRPSACRKDACTFPSLVYLFFSCTQTPNTQTSQRLSAMIRLSRLAVPDNRLVRRGVPLLRTRAEEIAHGVCEALGAVSEPLQLRSICRRVAVE